MGRNYRLLANLTYVTCLVMNWARFVRVCGCETCPPKCILSHSTIPPPCRRLPLCTLYTLFFQGILAFSCSRRTQLKSRLQYFATIGKGVSRELIDANRELATRTGGASGGVRRHATDQFLRNWLDSIASCWDECKTAELCYLGGTTQDEDDYLKDGQRETWLAYASALQIQATGADSKHLSANDKVLISSGYNFLRAVQSAKL